tara:strand:- start:1659 stop:1862 length:204 start_codon:yes stop_codon:yes gene_type:complete
MKEIVEQNTWIINRNDDYTVINYGYVEKDGVLLAGQPVLEKYYTEDEWRLSLENYDIYPDKTPPKPE